MKRPVPVHYLRPNESEWTPPTIVIIDTETYPVDADRDVHGMRCWVACRIDRPGGLTAPQSRVDASGYDAASLAATIAAWTRGRPSLWVYAHNLTYDLAVTRLPVELSDAGWEVTDFALDGRSPWLRLANGRKHVTLVDSFSWLPVPLATVAPLVGIVKPPLPGNDDDAATWLARCQADVDILAAAMTTLMDWWQRSGRGRWSVTGAASGWNAFRHTDSPYRVVIDPDTDAIAVERAAIYGGKRFVGKVGRLTPGAYAELDFTKAYTVIARDMPVPWKRMGSFASLSVDDPNIRSDTWGIIAECEIETDTPRYPVRDGGRVWYPVGRFRTTLAGPDIVDARDRGALRSIGAGYMYRLAPIMRPWATWLLDLIADQSGDVPDVAKISARAWGRSVIGKWAQHSFDHMRLGYSPVIGWSYEEAWDADTHSPASIVDIGGYRYLCKQAGDGDNAFPAILSYVESYVRVGLNAAIAAIGSDAFVQCDTDGMLVSAVDVMKRARHRDTFVEARAKGADPLAIVCERISALVAPLTLRVKARYSRVEVIGPQHVVIDGHRRFAGMPSRSDELPDGRVGAWTWPKMAYQMASGDDRGYVRQYVTYRVPVNLAAGFTASDGRVLPVEYGERDDGSFGAVPWSATRWHRDGVRLSDRQSDAVSHLIEGDT